MLPRLSALLLLGTALAAFGAPPPNTLTGEEKAGGWELLFDGTSTKGWHVIGQNSAGTPGWAATEGELQLRKPEGKTKTMGKDIVTDRDYSDFDLKWEWKISPAGNSGLKYNLPDKTKGVGCEYQMIDDQGHPDGKVKGGTHSTASLYDLIAPAPDAKAKPVGEWNESRVLVQGNHVIQWLNGVKSVEFDFGSEELKKLIATSKFKDTPGWGVKTSSPILLQDHGDEVSVRNMKIKPSGK